MVVPQHKLTAVQHAALNYLSDALKAHWGLGENIVLCWTDHPQGVEILLAPYNFLSRFSASLNNSEVSDRLEILNGQFIQQLISGSRYFPAEEFSSTARRFYLEPVLVPMPVALKPSPAVVAKVDNLVRSYSIHYVESRAVLLFDIVDYSLVTPFEQTSQLSSLVHSLNSVAKKMQDHGVDMELRRSTTGDGYYVWCAEATPQANATLFQFMLLVVADNAIAFQRGEPNTVPRLRTGFHIGGHFEFYQAQDNQSTMSSYIVGEVTIELARMLEHASAGQIILGDINTRVPTSFREGAYLVSVDTQGLVSRFSRQLHNTLQGVKLGDQRLAGLHCYLTGENGIAAGQAVKRFSLTDKHGFSRQVYNLRVNIRTEGGLSLAVGSSFKPAGPTSATERRQNSWALPRLRGRHRKERTKNA